MAQRMEAPAGEVAFNGWSRQQLVHYTVDLLYSMPKPTIAAVNGAAAGLGADMALSCDFVLASQEASFAWSYIKTRADSRRWWHVLFAATGRPRAGEGTDFQRAQGRCKGSAGNRHRGSPERAGFAIADAHAWAAELSSGSATALALGKSILNQSYELSAHQVFAQGSQAQAVCYTSREHRDSVLAFLNKTN